MQQCDGTIAAALLRRCCCVRAAALRLGGSVAAALGLRGGGLGVACWQESWFLLGGGGVGAALRRCGGSVRMAWCEGGT